jgi:30S ribosomal protein 3
MENKTFQLKLKIAWFQDFLGLAIDQVQINQNYSLTPYYFWPKTEAWEQLKLELDSKFWLTKDEKIKILKMASDVMNYWLSSRDNRNFGNIKETFPEIEILELQN